MFIKVLAGVVSNIEIDGEHQFERRMFGSNPEQLRSLAAWLVEQQAEQVVMESRAQYWKPVWEALEQYWRPMCQADLLRPHDDQAKRLAEMRGLGADSGQQIIAKVGATAATF